MKENHSLSLTTEITKQLRMDLTGAFYDMFPFDKLSKIRQKNNRDRIYNQENTLLAMILTMVEKDKSMQNTVNKISLIHRNNRQRIETLEKQIQAEYNNPKKKRQVGRPRKSLGRIAKSKTQDISTDTSAYSQARIRLLREAVDIVFEDSRELKGIKYRNNWHGYKVFISDGTYLQMQDTEAMREKFMCKEDNTYPKGLLEVIIEQGSGVVYDYELDSTGKSELELLSGMIGNIPQGSLLLADDLYNCFAIFCLLRKQGVEIIVPGKRQRNYKVIKTIADGDEIVEIKKKNNSKWLHGNNVEAKTIIMRRIEYENPHKDGEYLVLYTSLIDEGISKTDIIMKYESRWDIEISIREIKTMMDVNIVRSKSPDTAYKEVSAALIAYNYIRRKIVNYTDDSAFSPEEDIIQKYYEINDPVLLDRLGRKYSKWSPGRGGYNKN